MNWGRLADYRIRVRTHLEAAFREDHPPRQVARSFALGVFITSLPTLGVGLLVFVLIAYLFESISKLALFASVVVLNPVAKWGVYAVSFWIGVQLLGRPDGITLSEVSLSAGPEVVIRLLIGNLIIAAVFTAVGYLIALRVVEGMHRRDIQLDELVVED